jgi:hypothetical protein
MTNSKDEYWEKIAERRPSPAPRFDPDVEQKIEGYKRNVAADKVRHHLKELILSAEHPEHIAFTYVDGEMIAAFWDGEREHHFSVFVEMNRVVER